MPTELLIPSSLDGTMQPSLFTEASTAGKAPLLVSLHTWSFDRFNTVQQAGEYAEKYGWHVLFPEFRGPNLRSNPHCTEACGSPLAKQDIVDAIDYVCEHYAVDTDNIFLLGCSGGGHMSLLMAGYCPERFKAIGAFVPITDVERWLGENPRYTDAILACCNSDPEEMKRRSPMTYIDTIAKSNTKIFHGKYDPSVPVGHSITLFNRLTEAYPQSRVFLDVFDGGHEIDMEQAMYWFLSQYTADNKTEVTA